MKNRYHVHSERGCFSLHFDTEWAAKYKAQEWAKKFEMRMYVYDRETGEIWWFD